MSRREDDRDVRNDRHLSMERSASPGSRRARSTPSWSPSPTCRAGCRASGCTARYFVDHVVEHGTEGCNYLLAVDVDMNTVDGYAISSWERGYGDMEFVLDERTIRLLTHLPATAMVQCDLVWPDHSPVVQSPRTILQHAARPAAPSRAGRRWPAPSWSSSPSTRPTRRPHDAGYRDLTPVNQYNVDYSILGTTRVEPLLRAIRNHMYDAGLDVEGAKGECNFGQHEIGFLYADALTTADNHAVYKTAAKEIAAQQGKAITFMAKYNEREGSSCHIHLSLRGDGRRAGLLGRGRAASGRRSTTTSSPACSRRWPTSRCSTRPTSTPTSASPTARSRRPRSRGASTTAPARCAWSATAPAPGWRTGCPARDVNPYLALAAMLAGGLHGIEQELPLEDGAGRQRLHLRRARGARHAARRRASAFAASEIARAALRRRGRRPLRQHGRRRARGLQRGRHRLGAAPRIREAVSDRHLHRHQPGDRAAGGRRTPGRPGRDRRRDRGARTRPSRPGGRSPPASGPRCCAASPPSSTPTSRSSPSSRSATPATPGATRAGRPATSATA